MSQLFPKGERRSPQFFVGEVYLTEVIDQDKNNDFSIGSVTFEKGARTNWHTHPRGQVLIITAGKGWYQEKGKPAKVIQTGDVVNIPENVVHWHGASQESEMIHLAITNYVGEQKVTWLEPVSEEDYLLAHQ